MVSLVKFSQIMKNLKYISTQKELNLWQRRQLELSKDYDLTISYHLGKVNIVADDLSRKLLSKLVILITTQKYLLLDLEKFEIEIQLYNLKIQLANFIVQPTLIKKN